MVDEKARRQIADQASWLMAAGWRGNPNMSGDDRDFMSPSMRRKHDDKARAVVDFVLSQVKALSPGSTGEAEGWRDIESAPKDGTQILAFARSDLGQEFYAVAQWAEPDGMGSVAGWFWTYRIRPSHWRPLPAPPGSEPAALLRLGSRLTVDGVEAVVVPVEPSEAMLRAGAGGSGEDSENVAVGAYRAMLSAAGER